MSTKKNSKNSNNMTSNNMTSTTNTTNMTADQAVLNVLGGQITADAAAICRQLLKSADGRDRIRKQHGVRGLYKLRAALTAAPETKTGAGNKIVAEIRLSQFNATEDEVQAAVLRHLNWLGKKEPGMFCDIRISEVKSALKAVSPEYNQKGIDCDRMIRSAVAEIRRQRRNTAAREERAAAKARKAAAAKEKTAAAEK